MEQQFQQYKLIRKLGAGGMGEVYLAEDTKLKRNVALKFLPPGYSADPDFKARFKHEAQATAALNHPHIITVYDIDEHEGRMYLVLEHVPGTTLEEVIKSGKLKLSSSLDLISQICEGLAAAHKAGIVHRDIKPSNILISDEGQAKILDFGLAKMSGVTKLTKEGSTLGTLQYQSPEQSRGETVDERSDIFSVGVTLYEMITGHLPFEADYDEAVRYSISYETPEPLARYKSGVPDDLQRIVGKALSKDPAHRYQHADEMLADLRRLKTDSPPTRTKRLRTALAVSAAAVTVVIIAGYIFLDHTAFTSGGDSGGWDNSVAVLVFRNLSSDPDHEFFCEGMTDEIIGRLSTIKNLKVTSMQSMLRFKGADLDLKKIGGELGVENILEGNIQIIGGEVRVRAQLIRVRDDAHIWTEKYEREMANVFDIQDEISSSIAEVLEIALVGGEKTFVSRRGTDDIEAFNAYVRGRHFWRKRTEEGLKTALKHFENAVALDPNYAAGWSGLSDGWSMLARYSYLDQLTGYSKADTFSLQALELDPNLAEAHTSRGWVLYLQSNYAEAEKHFLKAIELNPGYVWGQLWYSAMLTAVGRNDEAAAQLQIAYKLDPLSPALLHTMAIESRRSGNLEKTIELYESILEIEPFHPESYTGLTQVYFDAKDTAKAFEIAETMIQQLPENWKSYKNKGWILWQLGRLDEAQESYEQSIEAAPDLWGPYNSYALFLQQGRFDIPEAVKYAEKAVELDSLQAWPRNTYAHMLRVAGRMEESVEQCEKVMELAPYDPESYRAYGWAIGLGFHRYEEAITYMQKALELNPRHVITLNGISLMYAYVGKTEDALKAINKRIEIDQSYVGAIQRKAVIFSMGGMFDSALVWFRKYHELRPYNQHTIRLLGDLNTIMRDYDVADSIYNIVASSSDSIRRGWGRAYAIRPLLHQGRFSEAHERLEDAIEVDISELGSSSPLRNKYYLNYKLCLEYLDNREKALEQITRYEQDYESVTSKNDLSVAWIKCTKAIALAAVGKVEEARKTVEELLNTAGENSDNYLEIYYVSLAEINRLDEDYESAVKWRTKALEINADYNNRLNLGMNLVGAEKYTEAVGALEAALSKYDGGRYGAPDESVICHYYLGRAYEGVGKTEEAITQYETFLEIWKNADEGLESVEDARARLVSLKHGS